MPATAERSRTKSGGDAEWSAGKPWQWTQSILTALGSRREDTRGASRGRRLVVWQADPGLRLTGAGCPDSAGRCVETGRGWGRPWFADPRAVRRMQMPRPPRSGTPRCCPGAPGRSRSARPDVLLSHASWQPSRWQRWPDVSEAWQWPRQPPASGPPRCRPDRAWRLRSAEGEYARAPGGGSSPGGRRR
jgi:hypothetical protein